LGRFQQDSQLLGRVIPGRGRYEIVPAAYEAGEEMIHAGEIVTECDSVPLEPLRTGNPSKIAQLQASRPATHHYHAAFEHTDRQNHCTMIMEKGAFRSPRREYRHSRSQQTRAHKKRGRSSRRHASEHASSFGPYRFRVKVAGRRVLARKNGEIEKMLLERG